MLKILTDISFQIEKRDRLPDIWGHPKQDPRETEKCVSIPTEKKRTSTLD